MLILGLSCFFHDSAVAVVKDGEILFCLQEERVTRIKGDKRFPEGAITAALKCLNLELTDFDSIVFYEDSSKKLERVESTVLKSISGDIQQFENYLVILRKCLDVLNGEARAWPISSKSHHHSHVASSYYAAPFRGEEAACLCVDSVGEWESSSYWTFDQTANKLLKRESINFPNSLGIFYSAFTAYLGFKINSGEYKVMGLAPYGRTEYQDLIETHVLRLNNDDGKIFNYELNTEFISPHLNGKPYQQKLIELLGAARMPETEITQKQLDIASSVQAVLEKALLQIWDRIFSATHYDYACYAGGVALNCTANGVIRQKYKSKNFFIQPASGDSGGALGAALADYYEKHNPHKSNEKFSPYLGPKFTEGDAISQLGLLGRENEVRLERIANDHVLVNDCAEALENGSVVGWFQGRSEFGPRALGNRSILASPTPDNIQQIVNKKIKFRESFRPFAPALLEEDFNKYFEGVADEYMLATARLRPNFYEEGFLTDGYQQLSAQNKLKFQRAKFNAVIHVDGSARCQLVREEANPLFFALLKSFKKLTGLGVLLNTSFNLRGEPVVLTPKDAILAFLATNIDVLYIGKLKITKSLQWAGVDSEYIKSFPAD